MNNSFIFWEFVIFFKIFSLVIQVGNPTFLMKKKFYEKEN